MFLNSSRPRGISKTKLCIACLLATLAMMVSLSILFYVPEVRAQAAEDLVVIKKSGTSLLTGAAEAAKEIQSRLTSEAAREQVIDLVGEKRYQKNRQTIESKIIRQSSKFIPYVNPGTPAQDGSGWKMDVELQISPASMRRMVLEAGLLNDAEGPASLLPLIAVTDRTKGLAVRWWQGESKDDSHKTLVTMSRLINEKAQLSFAKEGFHVIKPQGLQVSPLPEPYRTEQPSASDLVFISDFFKSKMIIKGEVRFKDSKNAPGATFCALKLQVVQPSSGRSIGEVTRQFVTEVGPFEAAVMKKLNTEIPDVTKDLATQVLEAWQRGTLNTNLLKLTVRGQLNAKQLATFKQQLSQNMHELKTLKERLFENGQTVFEADYTGEIPRIIEKLRATKLTNFEMRLTDSSTANLILDVRAI